MTHEELIIYLIKNGCSRKILAEVLETTHKELSAFCRRKGIQQSKNLEGYARIKQHRRNKKILAILYKGGACSKCNYNKCFSALDFHHTDPAEKDFTISTNINMSWETIKSELDKCILVCSNCHREIHSDWENIEIESFKTKEEIHSSLKSSKIQINWPADEELRKLVWETPRSKLAIQLGVSDRAIAKRCSKRNIEQPGRGYWTQFNKNQ